jgi:hypothetical protein
LAGKVEKVAIAYHSSFFAKALERKKKKFYNMDTWTEDKNSLEGKSRKD